MQLSDTNLQMKTFLCEHPVCVIYQSIMYE